MIIQDEISCAQKCLFIYFLHEGKSRELLQNEITTLEVSNVRSSECHPVLCRLNVVRFPMRTFSAIKKIVEVLKPMFFGTPKSLWLFFMVMLCIKIMFSQVCVTTDMCALQVRWDFPLLSSLLRCKVWIRSMASLPSGLHRRLGAKSNKEMTQSKKRY